MNIRIYHIKYKMSSSNDGRETIRQSIDAIRKNNPDILAAIGEPTDNSVSWGLAENGGIFVWNTKIIIIDDGKFDEKRISIAFNKIKTEDIEKEYYNDNKGLGKYNYGLTESLMLLGNKGTIIVKNNDSYKENIIDFEDCKEQNRLFSVCNDANNSSISNFNKYFKKLNSTKQHGTMLIIENLIQNWDDESFLQLKRFLTGLYSHKCHHTTDWYLFNNITENNPMPIIIKADNLNFGCLPYEVKSIFVYNDDLGQKIYLSKDDRSKKLLYKFEITTYFFKRQNIEEEKKIFGSELTTGDRVGYQIRRGGRLLTGLIPKLWRLHTGESRGKGIRIVIDIPINKYADEDWCVGTFKKITDDTCGYFSDNLRKFIKENFNELNNKKDRAKKKEQAELIKKYKLLNESLSPQSSLMDLNSKLNDAFNERDTRLADPEDLTIQKRSGNVWKAINIYTNELNKLIQIKENETIEKKYIEKLNQELDINDKSKITIEIRESKNTFKSVIENIINTISTKQSINNYIEKLENILNEHTPPSKPIVTPANTLITPEKPVATPVNTVVTPSNTLVKPAKPVATPVKTVVAPSKPVAAQSGKKITKKYITEKELIKMITQKNKGKNIEESKVLTFIDNL